MGYYVELRAPPGELVTVNELRRRVSLAGLTVHPEYGEPDFLFEHGILTLNSPEKIRAGNWAWVRMSWSANEEELKKLIELAEKIGARVYDASINDYVTWENFDRALGELRKGYERVAEIFGVVDLSNAASEGPPSSGPASKRRKQ